MKDQSKKKSKKGLWITLIIIFAVIVIPLGTVFILFYDSETCSTVKDPNFKAETTFYNSAVDALDNVQDKGKIELNINQDVFNQILLLAFEDNIKNDATLSKFIKGLSMEVKDDQLSFILDLDAAGFFKSRARIDLTISEEMLKNNSNVLEKALVLSISDIKLGRVGGFMGLVEKMVPNLFNDSFIKDMIGNTIPVHSDMNNKKIYIFKSEIADTIVKNYTDNGLLATIFKEFFEPDLFDLFTINESGLVANLNIEAFHSNSDFVNDMNAHKDIDWASFKVKTQDLIKNGKVEKDKATDIYQYLVKGYERSDDTIKAYVSSIDLSSIDIMSKTSYQGVFTNTNEDNKINVTGRTLEDIATTNRNDLITIQNTKEILKISEEELNEAILSSNIIGDSYLLDRYVEQDSNVTYAKVNPITITDIYANIVKTGIKFVIVISINGYETYICLDAKYVGLDTSHYQLDFSLSNSIYFGNKKADGFLEDSILSLLEDGLSNQGVISYDKSSKHMFVSFDDIIQISGIRPDIELLGQAKCLFEGDSLVDNGALSIIVE